VTVRVGAARAGRYGAGETLTETCVPTAASPVLTLQLRYLPHLDLVVVAAITVRPSLLSVWLRGAASDAVVHAAGGGRIAGDDDGGMR
jgi:hypothetical protein